MTSGPTRRPSKPQVVKDTVEEKIITWQKHRLSEGTSKKSVALGLNDFVQLGLGE